MNEININIGLFKGKRILIEPLNWGLGHATRCIPIIRLLIENNIEVAIASDGESLTLLEKEFPNLRSFKLPSYDINYPFRWIELNILFQSYKFANAIRKEKKRIKSIVQDWCPDVIISDNRYGCRSKACKSVFMTHQINLIGSNLLFQTGGRIINKLLINKFDEIWIPDFAGVKSIEGELSNMDGWTKNHLYINPLSRLKKFESVLKQDIVVVLSGPEPARTKLEQQLINIFSNLDFTILLVRGTLKEFSTINNNENIKIVDFLGSKSLNRALLESDLVVCRSGYSSIMDLNRINKRAILIPTQGQTEQEYLADYHSSNPLYSVWGTTEPTKKLGHLIKEKLKRK